MSSGEFSKIVWLAFFVVILATAMLGMIIGYDLNHTTTAVSSTSNTADVTLVVQGGVKLGPDGLLHDAFTPCNFTVYAGQQVNLTLVNYDTMEHTFTSSTLDVNYIMSPSNETGVPSVSNFQFTEATPGVYRWYCTAPCDTAAGGWAMTTGSDGQLAQIGYMGGFVTVVQG